MRKDNVMARMWKSIVFGTIILVTGIQPLARAEVVDRIVAIVNEDIITLSKLNKATRAYRKNIEASQGSDAQKKEMLFQLQQQALQQLVDITLTKQEAQKLGIQITDADIDAAIENVKKEKKLDDEALEQGLASEGMTLQDYREQMRENIIQSMLINRTVRSKVVITDAEIQAYYDANQATYAGVKKYHLKNIITETKAQIMEVESKLAAKKADFSTLARNYSIGSNASQGGELGVFEISSISQEIGDAVQGLEKGQYTKILPAGSAFQILYVEDIVIEGRKSLEEAKPEIQDILFKDMAEEQFKKWLTSLKENAHIKLML